MPDKDLIYNRLYAVDGMLTSLYERLDGKTDISTVEMLWGFRDYLEHAIEDVQALIIAMESRKEEK